MILRREEVEDHERIQQLTTAAFKGLAHSSGTEAKIIDRLRKDGDLTLSLVATIEDELIGHIAFSPVSIGKTTKGWYGLGPVSVRPNHQRHGVGSALINEGLNILRAKGASGCALIGDPSYYARFGFVSDGNVHYQELPDMYVQWISFDSGSPKGELVYSSAFDG